MAKSRAHVRHHATPRRPRPVATPLPNRSQHLRNRSLDRSRSRPRPQHAARSPQGPPTGQNSPTSPKGLNYRMTIRHRAQRPAPKRRRPQLAAVSRRSLATAARPDETSWPQQTGKAQHGRNRTQPDRNSQPEPQVLNTTNQARKSDSQQPDTVRALRAETYDQPRPQRAA